MLIESLANSIAVPIIVGFCLAIIVNVSGHYFTARAFNVKVMQFALGFGPAIFSYRRGKGWCAGSTEKEYKARIQANPADTSLGETEFRVNWLPLGGYVKMGLAGFDLLHPEAEIDPRSFLAAPFWARLVMVASGIVASGIFGLACVTVAFMLGVTLTPPLIGVVKPDSPAATAYAVGHENDLAFKGLRPGDSIEQFDGHSIVDFSEVAGRASLVATGGEVSLTVRREGVREPLRFTFIPESNPETGVPLLGLASALSLTITDEQKLAAELTQSGVEPGMAATAVNEKPITRFDQLESAVIEARGAPIRLSFSNARKSVSASVAAVPEFNGNHDVINLAGLVPVTRVRSVIPDSAAMKAGIKTGDVIARMDHTDWPGYESVPVIVSTAKGRSIDIALLRDNSPLKLDVVPGAGGRLGITLEPALHMNIVGDVLPGSPFAPLALSAGTRIKEINGAEIAGFADIQRALAVAVPAGQAPAMTVRIQVQRSTAGDHLEQVTVAFNAEQAIAVRSSRWSLPPLMSRSFEALHTPLKAGNPWSAMMLGLRKTRQYALKACASIARSIHGSVQVRELRGPVAIVHVIKPIERFDGAHFLLIVGMVAIALTALNMLPVPIFSGGQFVLMVFEKYKGAAASLRAQTVMIYLALAALGLLALAQFTLDLTRIF